jgi:hypothetical protein
LLVLPFLWPLVRDIISGESYYLKPPVKKGIDPAFLLIPPARHPLWGGAVAGLYERWKPYASVGFTGYLGASSLAICVAGWIAARRPRPREDGSAASPRGPWILWTCLFLLPAVLALGDTLVVTGRDTGLPMPFAIIEGAPVLKTLRVANRFLVPAMLALSVLVALGARSLLERAPRRSGLLLAGLCALVAVDFLWVPYPLREIPRPAWAEAVARCAPGILLDIPGSYQARESEDMYYQTIHGRPLVGGYTSCLPPFVKERVARYPFLQLVFEGRPSPEVVAHAGDPAQLEADVRAVLDDLPVAVVVLHLEREKERLERLRAAHRKGNLSHLYNPEKGLPAATMEAIDRVLRDLWGPPCYEDASARVYARPAGR